MSRARPDLESVLAAGRPRRTLRTLIWVAAVGLTVAGLWYWWASSNGGDVQQYVTQPVARGDLTIMVTATGTIEPTNEVAISSELSGTILSVEVDFNDPVVAGQILARLNTDKLEANTEYARATVEARRARMREAEITAAEMAAAYERAVQLEARGVASRLTFDTAKAANDRAVAVLAGAKADLDIARATLKINEADLAKACICSPIDGIVLDRNVEVGQIVASSLQAPVLFTLAEDLAGMELQVDIDEADIGKVDVGDPATFTVEAHRDSLFPATISVVRYAPETVEGVVTYKAILTVDNSDLLLRPGMTATAEITVEEIADAVLVPNAALRFTPPAEDDASRGAGLLGLLIPRPPVNATVGGGEADRQGRHTIWVLREGAPTAVLVNIGATDGLRTEITDGDLSETDMMIVDVRTAS